jgi:hypothetical protein
MTRLCEQIVVPLHMLADTGYCDGFSLSYDR